MFKTWFSPRGFPCGVIVLSKSFAFYLNIHIFYLNIRTWIFTNSGSWVPIKWFFTLHTKNNFDFIWNISMLSNASQFKNCPRGFVAHVTRVVWFLLWYSAATFWLGISVHCKWAWIQIVMCWGWTLFLDSLSFLLKWLEKSKKFCKTNIMSVKCHIVINWCLSSVS